MRQARELRMRVLDVMDTIIAAPRTEMSPYAPRIETLKINPDKIGLIIGELSALTPTGRVTVRLLSVNSPERIGEVTSPELTFPPASLIVPANEHHPAILTADDDGTLRRYPMDHVPLGPRN